jgi:hypothetical protein
MARPNNPHKNWLFSHDPEARPLGCNGRYGTSGRVAHERRGEPVCPACRDSSNHYRREAKRGNPGSGRRLQPCGTNAAAKRHRRKGEKECLPCAVARSNYNGQFKKKPKKS